MKKTTLFTLIISCLLSFSTISFATSGTCSWHDGVNCEAGADWDGSVICKDGWKDSSANYSDMKGCKTSSGLSIEDLQYLYAYHKIDAKACLEWIPNSNMNKQYDSDICTEGFAGITLEQCKSMKKSMQNSTMAQAAMSIFDSPEEKAYLIKCQPCYEKDQNNKIVAKNDLNECLKIKDYPSYYTSSKQECGTHSILVNGNNCQCEDGYVWANDSGFDCVQKETKNIGGFITPFTDLKFSDNNAESITFLYQNDILDGYPDGTFKPDNTLNRAELLKIVILAKYLEPTSDFSKKCFKDISSDSWYAPYVCFAKENNIIKGYSNGTFKPDQEISYSEALKITLETMGYSPSETTDPWYKTYLDEAATMGVGLDLDFFHKITRGEMAQLIVNIMKY